jgi:DNA-binding LacI/PurR family transcriptional regulator
MSSSVTLEDIAKRAGVHRSTVALALRDHPRISREMRARIKALAAELGYAMHPMVAALMQARRKGRALEQTVLAYVTCHPTRYGWRPPAEDRPDYFPGAEKCAQGFGCKLEHFWLAEPGMTPARFCEILLNRGIRGVLIGRLPPGLAELDLLWENFACVALGRTLRSPVLHRVTEDHHACAILAMEKMWEHGYKRIGFVFSESNDSPRVGDRWLGGFMRQQLRRPTRDRIDPFLADETKKPAEAFAAWLAKNKPDALLVTKVSSVLDWLKQSGRRVPHDIAVATLVNDHLDQGWSGVHCDHARMGRLATEMLLGMLHRGETGVPADPHEVLLTGIWKDGHTLPPVDSLR